MVDTYVALLFSIGIADGRRLVMDDWRTMMEELGLDNSRTLIATGNAVFKCEVAAIPELEARLENEFERRFGRRVDTIVRAAAPFRRVVEGNPFPKESKQDGSRVMVRFMREPLNDDSLAALQAYRAQGERVKVVNGDLWVHFPNRPVRSRLMPVIGSKRLGIGTVRNWNTVRRLNEMLDPP